MATDKKAAKPAGEKKVKKPFVEKIQTPVGLLLKKIGKRVVNITCSELEGDARKTLNNKVAPKWSNKTLSDLVILAKGDDYETLKKLAKAAAADADQFKNTPAVKAMWKFMEQYSGGAGTRSRGALGLGDDAMKLL